VATLEDIRLLPPEDMAGIVIQCLQMLEVGCGRAAVIRGHDEQGVLGQAVAVERIHDSPHSPVALVHEIAVRAQAGLAVELSSRHDVRVRRVQREIKKERIFGS